MKELYNVYIEGEFLKSIEIELEEDDLCHGEPPSEISNDGLRLVLANEDENKMPYIATGCYNIPAYNAITKKCKDCECEYGSIECESFKKQNDMKQW